MALFSTNYDNTEDPSPLDYNATLERLEKGIAPIDATLVLTSIAISLASINRTLADMNKKEPGVTDAITEAASRLTSLGMQMSTHGIATAIDNLRATVYTGITIATQKGDKGNG